MNRKTRNILSFQNKVLKEYAKLIGDLSLILCGSRNASIDNMIISASILKKDCSYLREELHFAQNLMQGDCAYCFHCKGLVPDTPCPHCNDLHHGWEPITKYSDQWPYDHRS